MTDEITTKSWGSRLKDAFVGIIVGIALIVGAIVLVFWNENHSLHMAQSLEQTQKKLTTVAIAPIIQSNNLKVVYLTGLATTADKLTDSLLNITLNAIKLNRTVDMYQWQEKIQTRTESQMGGSEREIKTYSYSKVWSDKLIDSSTFNEQQGHQNPQAMPIQSQIVYADKVTVGDFSLPQILVKKMTGDKTVDLAEIDILPLQSQLNKSVHLVNRVLYLGEAQTPKVGDLRIKLTAVYPQEVSIIAQQIADSLQPYLAPAGESIILLAMGSESADQMVAQAKSENRMMAWLLRGLCLLLLVIGFALIMKPLVVLADVIPFLGSIVGFGTGLIAFVCGLSIWLVTTAIAWFTTRPLLSLGLIIVVVILWYALVKNKASTAVAKYIKVK